MIYFFVKTHFIRNSRDNFYKCRHKLSLSQYPHLVIFTSENLNINRGTFLFKVKKKSHSEQAEWDFQYDWKMKYQFLINNFFRNYLSIS